MDAGRPAEEPEDPLKGYDLPEKLREFRAERRGPDPIEDFLIMENLVQNELDRLDCADDPKVAVKMFKEARQHGLEISCDSKVAELGDVRELRDRWTRLDKSAISPKLRTWLDTLFRYYYFREILEILRKEHDQIRDEQKRRLIGAGDSRAEEGCERGLAIKLRVQPAAEFVMQWRPCKSQACEGCLVAKAWAQNSAAHPKNFFQHVSMLQEDNFMPAAARISVKGPDMGFCMHPKNHQ